MTNTTLDDLQRRALLRADMPLNSQRYEDGELANYINQSLFELQDILIGLEGLDRFLDGYEFSTVAGQTRYDLPDNFYKAAGLDLQAPDNKYYTLLQYNHSDRMLYQNATDFFVNGIPRHRYRIVRGHLEIHPAPEGAHSCVLNYVPQLTKLVATSDTVDNVVIEGWLEYIEIDVAIKISEKDDNFEKAGSLGKAKGGLVQRMQLTSGRDLEKPEVTPDGNPTLFNLRIQSRYKANLQEQGSKNTSLVTDRELTHYINRSLEELYDMVVKAYDANYFLDGYEFTTVAGQKDYNLPTDFYKLGGIDIIVSGETYSLSNYNFAERNYYESNSNVGRWDVPLMHYQLQGNSLRILPKPDANYATTIWYTKMPPALTSDSDQVEHTVIRGWLEYVTTDAAIKMLNKALLEMSGPKLQGIQAALQNLQSEKQRLRTRIETMAENRNWGQPEKMVDIDRTTWSLE